MGFPIALGTKSSASRVIPFAQPIEEFDYQDGSLLVPSSPSTPSFIVATSVDQELLASITLYYYNMCRKDDSRVAYVVAELHIQISLLAESTSFAGRDVLHRITLPKSSQMGYSEEKDSKYQHHQSFKPMATFSADRRYLTCLIPHPDSFSARRTHSSSSVIVFQLRRPKGTDGITSLRSKGVPPLPAYVVPSLLEKPIIPVATNPRMLLSSSSDSREEQPLSNATSICDVETSVGPLVSGLLLVGCRDGSVQVATYRPAVCSGVLYSASPDDRTAFASVVELDHWTEWKNHSERTFVGRLAVVWSSGLVIVFRSHFAESDDVHPQDRSGRSPDPQFASSIRSSSSAGTREVTDFSFGVISTHRFPSQGVDDEWDSTRSGTVVSAKWIAGSYLAVLGVPDTQCTVRVMGLYDYGKYSPVSTMIVTREQLDESVHGIFQGHSVPLEAGEINNCAHENFGNHGCAVLEYDAHTDCLAITSFLREDDKNARKNCFVCLWNWRTNVLGLMALLVSTSPYDCTEYGSLHFAIDHIKRRKIVLIGVSGATRTQLLLYKETYHIAVLSPPYEAASQHFKLRETNALLLSAESVSYPHCTKTSQAIKDFEVEWMEAATPMQYTSLFGAPVLAAIGQELGRSIAVASSRGFCVLDCTGMDRQKASIPGDETGATASRAPRWRVFANETHEKAFRVVAMTWWEGLLVQKSEFADTFTHTDDLLVTIIEVLESPDNCQGFYLSCWSGRDVELSAQLLQSNSFTNGSRKKSSWGILLPPDFDPVCIDLLACPLVLQGERCASVLLADSTYATKYFVYQLQVVESRQLQETRRYTVLCHCIANGNVGSPSELFLASSSFSSMSCDRKENAEDFAILGVVRKYGGGLDAVAVCSSNIVSVGQVIESADLCDDALQSAEISRYWLSDVLFDRKPLFVWTVQLACGRLLSWSVPICKSTDEINLLSGMAGIIHRNTILSLVHPKSIVLGFICPSGTASNWMQQSSLGAQRDFLGGSIPRSCRGCVLGVSQTVKCIQTSPPVDYNNEDSPSGVLDHVVLSPSDFKLYPPAFLPSLYVLAIDIDSDSPNPRNDSQRFDLHLKHKMMSPALQDMLFMSIQVIILRLVEKLAAIGRTGELMDSQEYARLRDILVTLVAGVRRQTTTLQFSAFFLQLGRQVEPSCLPHLFPIPETVADLFSISCTCGSVPTAVFAIPLLSDQKSSLWMCTSLFHHCICQLDASLSTTDSPYDITMCVEDLEATGGLFRFALKAQHRRSDVHRVVELEYRDLLQSDEIAPTSRYSVMCGITNMFRGSRIKVTSQAAAVEVIDDSPLLVHGVSDDRIKKLKEYGVGHIRRLSLWKDLHSSSQSLGNVLAVAARFVVATLYGGSALDTRVGWVKVAALTTILMQDVAQPENSGTALTHFMRRTKVNRWVALVPVDVRRGGLTHVLEYCMEHCHLDAELSNRVLDFLLVLLLRCDARSLGSDRPGLLLAAVVTAHRAERIPDVLDPSSICLDELSAAYFKLFPVAVGFSCSTNDDRMLIV